MRLLASGSNTPKQFSHIDVLRTSKGAEIMMGRKMKSQPYDSKMAKALGASSLERFDISAGRIEFESLEEMEAFASAVLDFCDRSKPR